jgi:hypothetical protein
LECSSGVDEVGKYVDAKVELNNEYQLHYTGKVCLIFWMNVLHAAAMV